MAQKLKFGGKVTVATAGTSVQLTTTDTIATSIVVQADDANSGKIYVGDSSVSSVARYSLAAGDGLAVSGDPRPTGELDELVASDIWLDASAAGQVAYWFYIGKR